LPLLIARPRARLASVALASLLGFGAIAGVVDVARHFREPEKGDRVIAWMGSDQERVERTMAELAPVVEIVRARVPDTGAVWCWSTTQDDAIYPAFLNLQTLLYPRTVWMPESVERMTRAAEAPPDAAEQTAVIVLHAPGDEDRRDVAPPPVPRARWRVALQAAVATVYVVEAQR